MILQRLSRAAIVVNLGLLITALAPSPAHAEPASPAPSPKSTTTPSCFQEDKDGVLWFVKGDDGQTKYSASLILSGVNDGIVITVTANEKHIKDAVGLAIKMRNVLQKSKRTPDKIPIVAWKDQLPGVGYTFYTDGTRCTHEKLGKKGIFRPSEAKQMLDRVVKFYRILMDEYVATGRWGKDHAEWTALEIVKP